MKCYFHPEKDAVATCQNCGKSLCKECAEKYHPCLCDDCYRLLKQQEVDELKSARKKMIKTFIYSILLGAIVFSILYQSEPVAGVVFGLMAFFVPYGWNYGNLLGLTWFFSISPDGCIMMVFYYFFKALIASFIGIFAFIAAIIRFVKIVKAEKTAEIEQIV